MQPHWRRWHGALEHALSGLLIFALPCAMLVLSVLALQTWAPRYAHDAPLRLPMHVLEDSDAQLTAETARTALEHQPQVLLRDTHLAEAPFWFSFSVPPPGLDSPSVVEFPSRHLVRLACWGGRQLDSLGEADRVHQQGRLFDSQAGFGLRLQDLAPGMQVLCQAQLIGPGRLTVQQWDERALRTATRAFERNAGLLEGGIVLLALFVFITALINRNSTYVLFAVWLLINLRMGALSAGWDVQWLGHNVPVDWLIQGRPITLALLYVVTFVLFRSLFREELPKVGFQPLLNLTQWSCALMLVLSVALPYAQFLPLIWLFTAVGSLVLVFFLVRIVVITHSTVAAWYGASIGVTLLASGYEVVAAAFGLQTWIGSVNSVTAALSSSLLATMAIAAQMRQEHRQRVQAQTELEHTYNVIPLGLFTLDPQGHFIAANPALQAALGPAVLVPGRDHWDHYFDDTPWQRLLHSLNAQPVAEFEVRGRTDDPQLSQGRRFLVKASRAGGRIEGSLQDVTERALATERLQFLANHDPLTQVLNRNGVQAELERALQPAGPGQDQALALAYLDLDRFKLINDMFGHSAGDEVLRQVCSRVDEVLQGGMHLGRVGGDEFVILMPNTHLANATLICQDIVNSLGNRPYRVGDLSFQVHGSVGLIEVVRGSSAKDAVSTADRACREAKKKRGSHLVVFERDSCVFQEHEAEIRLAGLLSGSDEIEGLYLEMQPIMSLKEPHHSLNFEVLLRMRDPDGQEVPTTRLITAAENSGRMGVIDRWVLRQTLAWMREQHGKLKHTRFICMNLSGASLNDERFVQDVVRMLEQYADVAPRLCLEITESVALHDLENTRRFIAQVHGFGAKVALDDFGAGYTSFSYLKELRGDLLKIDGGFIVNMNEHPANVAIVEAIVGLARNLGMKTIAEWAEDSATVQTLAEIGVDYVQGFAIARSQPPERLLRMRSSADFVADADLLHYLLLQAWPAPSLFSDPKPGQSTH
ncbi:EAL domain-containing protein [Alicycliphilus denitrificans]|uniref:Diguanylate cyclase/phosphodiesterase n=2 Tax=Alicycliphilus denitrificans TaxID=179636 RepID=F4G5Z9_ALIDK|nr:diguanylate cyclase [Alicycliphilus denitrificans BC]AEB86480.1 diguanylate cyclase/phosphodiesterase [Alicycliphilus denitrificans K601]QKD46371.1 EAL domain-containing protein [Alicycliphilus denitrificans]